MPSHDTAVTVTGGGAFGAPLTFSAASVATVAVMEADAADAERVLREGGFLEDPDPGR